MAGILLFESLAPSGRVGANRSGFTLLELMVVLGIIVLLGGLGIGAFQAAQRNYSLSSAAAEIRTVLLAARNTSRVTGVPSVVVVDPGTRTVEARHFETLGEWSFDEGGGEGALAALSAARYSVSGASRVGGRSGEGLDFRSGGHVDCGARAAYDVRESVRIEAWVRHDLVEPVPEPAAERRKEGFRLRAKDGRRSEEPAFAIVEKKGAYFLGMTPGAGLEAAIGDYRARTAEGVVVPGRWVFVTLQYDGESLSVAADGIDRPLEPLSGGAGGLVGGGGAAGPGASLPAQVPVTGAHLTISSPANPFRGVIDEVKLRGRVEPVSYTHADYQLIIGWKKRVHFDRHGRLDPAIHDEEVRIVLLELPEDGGSRTKLHIDTSRTFEEWLESQRARGAVSGGPVEVSRKTLEAELEARYLKDPDARSEVIRVDRLGVVR